MRVAVFLSNPWSGGMLRAGIAFARHLSQCTGPGQRPLEVVFSLHRGRYDRDELRAKLANPRIAIRETDWVSITDEELEQLDIAQARHPVGVIRPTDAGRDFLDCDLWITLGHCASPVGKLAPLRPYLVFAPDFIQRYVPEILSPDAFHPRWDYNAGLFATLHSAECVFVTTPKTGEDVVGYAGVPRAKVKLVPQFFDGSFVSPQEDADEHDQTGPIARIQDAYFLWVTNSTAHKNHLRAIAALELYYGKYGGRLAAVQCGPLTERLAPEWQDAAQSRGEAVDEYMRVVANVIRNSRFTQKRLSIVGELPDAMYARLMARARFCWHNVLYDNGTFAAIEAALLGTPTLSADYPQMRYLGEQFGINLEFFDPYSTDGAAQALKAMELSGRAAKPRPTVTIPADWNVRVGRACQELIDPYLAARAEAR
jgi:glycosyltransferase involved in cell wall biosynthesis